LDMSSKGRNHNQVKTHCPSGHPYSGWNCYTPPSGGRYCRKCITIRGRVYIQNKAARAAS
jgi:hypothetical protein